MSSEGVISVGGPRLHRLYTWFDPESVGVVTILLGIFQVLLSVPLAYCHVLLPKLFILPLVLGVIIVAGGSLTIANEKYPHRLLLRGCACSNVAGLLGTLLALCLYSYSMKLVKHFDICEPSWTSYNECPGELLQKYSWSVILLLLLYDTGAVIVHCLLSVSAFKALKTD